MKKTLLIGLLTWLFGYTTHAQCTTANVNWDNLDFLTSTGNYSGFVTAAQAEDQQFAFGPGVLRVQTTSNITINGENTTYTGTTGSYGAGTSISFATTVTSGTSTITLSFGTSAISALQFSLYDIDNAQKVKVTAFNGATPVSLKLSTASASSGIGFSGNPGTAPVINGISGDYTVTDNGGAVNVVETVTTSPITSVVLTFTNATGDFWISDLQACVTGTFPTNYYGIAQPWAGQPSYMAITPDTNLIQTVNPANGTVKTLFQESASKYVNSIAYDPYNHFMYYCLDGTSSGVYQKGIKKYDFNTETMSTLVADVGALKIPLYESGVESGAGAYYGGRLYLGIEGSNAARNSGRKSIVWRIEFDASFNPVSAVQVVAFKADNGSGTLLHDWADIVLNDGILYDWNSRGQGTNGAPPYNVNQYNLQTGVLTTYVTASSWPPKQNGITWNGIIYNMGTTIQQYNGTTSLTGTAYTLSGTGWVGGAGDGSEAFKPKADFGDAPASYDPGSTPAVHEMDTTLHLGPKEDREWLKRGATIYADADSDDAIGFVPLLCPCSGNFMVNVKVYNHTGANATLIAWLDYNGNNQFDASEAMTATVGSSTALQTVTLSWTNALTTYPNLATTYLRVRLTSASNSMTASNTTGYFPDGEVEDYRVFVNGFPLAVNMQNFTAAKTANDNVRLEWTINEDASLSRYYLQRSANGTAWTNVFEQAASGKAGIAKYSYDDAGLTSGTVYYRLQLMNVDGSSKMSEVKQIENGQVGGARVWPNPAAKSLSVSLNVANAGQAVLQIANEVGAVVAAQTVRLNKGNNTLTMDVSWLAKGLYRIQIKLPVGLVTQPFVKE